MSRLVDADALIDKLPKEYLGSIVHAMINEAPSIDIVFCKECIERDDDWCMHWGNVINPDDFCSYGEREGE